MRYAAPFAAALLALASLAQARPVAQETLPGLVKKADFIVVGQVLKIEDVGPEQSAAYNMPVMHKRATIRVLRGIKSSDASAVDFRQITVDYLALLGDVPPDAPMFPKLSVNQVAVFPVKSADAAWRFVSEEDAGMIAPAAVQEITAGWPADIDGNIAFIYRELAGACCFGDFPTMSRVGAYLDALGPSNTQPADPVFGLIKAEISENLLHEDSRWMIIGAAAYVASGTPRPTLDALINGQIGGGAAGGRNPNDALPSTPSLRLATLNLRKAAKFQLPQRILMLLISHQEDPGMSWGIAKALVDNFDGDPMMLSMEDQELRHGKSGAIYVADYMVKDATHPLATAAARGARAALAYDGPARVVPDAAAYSETLRQTEGLLLRAGSDDDFTYLLDQVNQSRIHDPKTYEALIRLAGDSELSPADRVLRICRAYVDNNTAMAFPIYPGFRLSDMAALTAARIGKQDFGLNPTDPADKRNAAVTQASAWLKAKFPG